MARFTVSLDPSPQEFSEVAEELKKANLQVEDVYESINTLIISGPEKKVLLQKDKIKGILTIDPEGESFALE